MSGYEFCEGYWWIFPVIMILLCFFFMRRMGYRRWCGFSDHQEQKNSAIDILKNRYAQGDINQAEYEKKKKILEDQR